MSNVKIAVFRLITVLLVPLLFFGLLEGGLRITGYGHSHEYFSRIEIDGERYYQDNPDFGLQFFPVALNRTPLENTFSERRSPELLRIFVLGASAAKGFPDPEFGFSRQLEVMLSEALPGRKVEVINTAMTAINSHVVYEIAKSIPDGAADFSIVLLGNNEVVGPFGPGTVFAGFSTSLPVIRVGQWARRLRIGQLLSEIATRVGACDGEPGDEQTWKGMQMFAENEVRASDVRLRDVYTHYRDNLNDIVDLLEDGGSRVLLSTVPVNLRDSGPFASLHSADLSEKTLRNWESVYRKGREQFEAREWPEAIQSLLRAEKLSPDHADTHYLLGIAYGKTGDDANAEEHLLRARDLDALRFRADSTINEVIRSITAERRNGNLLLVDSERNFDRLSAPGLPGKELFFEHVHYSFSGNYHLARGFAEEILRALGQAPPDPGLSQREVARRTGYPNAETVKVMQRLVEMVGAPPFSSQVNQLEQEDFLRRQHLTLEREVGTRMEQIERYRQVVAEGKSDWRLRAELVRQLWKEGDIRAVQEETALLLQEYPHQFSPRLNLAIALSGEGRLDEALEQLSTASHYARGSAKKLARIKSRTADIRYRQGHVEDAIDAYYEIVRSDLDAFQIVGAAYDRLISLLDEVGRTGESATELERFREFVERLEDGGLNSREEWVVGRLAAALRDAGRDAQADEWLEKISP